MSRHCTLLFVRFLWCAYLTLALFGCAAPYADVKSIGLLPSYDGFVFGTVPEKARIAIADEEHAELSSMVVQACGVARAERCKENKLLPIASDSGANNFVLVVAQEDYGHVYYFDACEIPPRPYFVARDFHEFLGKIREMTPEELADVDAAVTH